MPTLDDHLATMAERAEEADALSHALLCASGFAYHAVTVPTPATSYALRAAVRSRVEAVDGDTMEWIAYDVYRDSPAGHVQPGAMTWEHLLPILRCGIAMSPPTRRRYVWFDASAAVPADSEAWAQFWSSVNIMRNTLMRQLGGVVAVSFPDEMVRLMIEGAPDTWSVRAKWTKIDASEPARP